jgi:hypothetical protein
MSALKAQPIGEDGRRRGPGRPPVSQKGSSVCAWLTIEKHDQLVEIAKREDKSVSKLVADAVQRTYFDPILKP